MITHFAVMMCLNQRLSYFARQCTVPGVFLQCCLIHFNCFFRLNYTRRKQNSYITFYSFLHGDQIFDLHCNCWAAKEDRIGQQHSCSLWTGSLFEEEVKKSWGEGPFSQTESLFTGYITEALNLGKLLVMKRVSWFRTFVPWVLETFTAQFPVSVKSLQCSTKLRPSAEDSSACGRPRSILPRAKENLWYPG